VADNADALARWIAESADELNPFGCTVYRRAIAAVCVRRTIYSCGKVG
jgi:hypothetical protein